MADDMTDSEIDVLWLDIVAAIAPHRDILESGLCGNPEGTTSVFVAWVEDGHPLDVMFTPTWFTTRREVGRAPRVFRVEIALHGGEELARRVFVCRRAIDDPELMGLIRAAVSARVRALGLTPLVRGGISC